MKKRLLCLVLTLTMMLSCLTVLASPASAAESAAPQSTGSDTPSYVDLYVKDGLLALFDAHSAKAASTALTEWRPVNLYGKTGYDSYIDPSRYSSAFSPSTRHEWKWVDGAVYPAVKNADAGAWANYTYLNLNSLGALIGTTYTVQEVFTQKGLAPVITNGVLTNYNEIKVQNGRYGAGRIGPYGYGGRRETNPKGSADTTNNLIGVVMESMYFGSTYIGHFTWVGESLGSTLYETLSAPNGTSLANYYVGDAAVPVERTVSRLGVETVDDGFKSTFGVFYQKAPKHRSGANYISTGYFSRTSAEEDVHKATTLQIATDTAYFHSIRIYNRELDNSEREQNHFADLCAAYGVDTTRITKLSSFTKYQKTYLYSLTSTMDLPKAEKGSAAYTSAKSALLDAIDAAITAAPAEPGENVKLYIKDGLVAVFDAFENEAGTEILEKWDPVYLFENKDYPDYIDPSLYSVRLVDSARYDWKSVDGGIRAVLTNAGVSAWNNYNYMDFTSLAELLGYTYTVQEVFTQQREENVIENGVLTNYDAIKQAQARVSANWIGPHNFGSTFLTGTEKQTDGVNKLVGVLVDQMQFGEISNTYMGHFGWKNAEHGAERINKLKAPDGTDLTKYYVGAATVPVERTISRLGYKKTTMVKDGATVDAWESTFNLYYPSTPWTRNTLSPQGAYSKVTDKEAEHTSKRMYLGGDHAIVHSIRIYNRALSQAEINYNHIIDVINYAGADYSLYFDLDSELKALVSDLMSSYGLTRDAEAVKEAFEKYAALAGVGGVDYKDTLYVTDGLTVLLSAFKGYSTPASAVEKNKSLWTNAVDTDTYAMLMGTGWKTGKNGGHEIVRTLDDYDGTRPEDIVPGTYAYYTPKEDYGIQLDGDWLPEGEYSLELVANPVGVTKDDGTRLIDTYTKYGIYIENGFAIGPLRAFQHASYRSSWLDGQMHRRWNYGKGNTPYADNGSKGIIVEKLWEGLEPEEIVTLHISRTIASNGDHKFTMSQGKKSTGFSVEAAKVISNKEANNMFRLMCGVAGTVFSVRLYERVLSPEEQAQNRFADLVYYYDIDLGVLEDLIKKSPTTKKALAESFADVDFYMNADEAQALFNKRLTAIWLSYNGFAVKNDLTDGLRYYYSLNLNALDAVIGAGIEVEVGTVINVNKDAAPTLDGYGYDYRIVAFDSTMGKESAIFVDESTYAVTVTYTGVGRELLGKNINTLGYVKMTYEDGSEAVYYTVLEESAPKSLFESYYQLEKEASAELTGNEALYSFVSDRVAKAYSNTFIYLDASAADGGNGSKEAPFRTFADAFAACKSILRTLTAPTNVTLEAADGRYSITETQTLLDADKPYSYSYFTVKSTGGNTVLTTTVDIDAGKFVLSDENIYTYQFPKDENGEYPAFRILHVNDKMATIATNGSDKAVNRENLFITAFDRTFDGAAQLAKDMSQNEGYDFNFVPESYKGRPDLIESFAFYRDQYIAYNEVYARFARLVKDIENGVKITSSYQNPLNASIKPVHVNGSAVYKEAHRRFLMQFMGVSDLLIAVHAKGLYIEGSFFKTYSPADINVTKATLNVSDSEFALYTDAFTKERNAIIASKNKNTFYSDFTVQSNGVDVRNVGKLYMPEDMIGDLRSLVEEGKILVTESTEAEIERLTEAQKNAEEAYLAAKKAYEEASAISEELVALKRAELVKAEDAKILIEKELKTARALLADMKHGTLWLRHALLPYGIELHHTAQWNYNILHLAGVDYADAVEVINAEGAVERHVAVYQRELGFQINEGYSTANRYVHAKNAYAYLDEAGEYYYDERNGKLHIYSETPVSAFDIEYATTDWMFTFFGIEKVNFENVQFTGTDDYWLTQNDYKGGQAGMSPYIGLYGTRGFQDRAALYFNDCSEIRVTGCRFYDLSCEAINAAGWNTDYYVAGNSFENIGSASIRFATHKPILSDSTGGSWFEGEVGARNLTIVDNYFNNVSTEYYVPALMVAKLDGGTIKNNTIIDCTYTAMSLGWDFNYKYDTFDYDNRVNLRNVDVSYNYIKGWMTEMGDGGAIYTCDPNQKTSYTDFYMNLIHHNYIVFSRNTGDGVGNMNCGIYFDICASNWCCYENVVAEQSYGAHADEVDYDEFGLSDEEAARQQLRRTNSHFVYLQHIDSQPVHNIYLKDNFYLNVRNTEEALQRYEIYKNYLTTRDGAKRNLVEEGSVYVVGLRGIPSYAQDIIQKSGSTGHNGDLALLLSNRY